MIKHFHLIAVGLILLGLFAFGAGVYLLAKELPNNSPMASSTPAPVPAATSIPSKPNNKPTPSPQPSAEPTATPFKPPPSSVRWMEWNSNFRGNVWKVNLTTSDKWFDTGIPYVTNDTLNVSEYGTQDIDTRTLIKVNGRTFSNKDGRQLSYFDSDGFAPSIRDTVKLKLEDGAEPVELELTVIHVNGVCGDYQNHKDIHEASFAWAENLVNRTKK